MKSNTDLVANNIRARGPRRQPTEINPQPSTVHAESSSLLDEVRINVRAAHVIAQTAERHGIDELIQPILAEPLAEADRQLSPSSIRSRPTRQPEDISRFRRSYETDTDEEIPF